jgi:hypothetical protein
MKGGTKILVIITICIILLSISFSGCFEDGKDEGKDDNELNNKKVNLNYQLIIKNSTINSIIYLPCIMDYNDDIVNNKNISIDGGKIVEKESNYGTCYEITNDEENLNLNINGIYEYSIPVIYTGSDRLLYLSLYKDQNNNGYFDSKDFTINSSVFYNIYYSERSNNTTFNLSFSQIWEDGQYEKQFIETPNLRASWNIYEMKFKWNIYNKTSSLN